MNVMNSANNNVDLQQEAKSVVLDEMEKMGLISGMKAQIKSSVLKILESQKQSVKQNVEFDYITPLHRLNKSKDILLACYVIKEFLQFYEMEYTIPIFENESNINESIKKETLMNELSLNNTNNLISSTNEPKPLLVQLISAYQQELQNSKQPINKGLDDSYGVKGHTYSNTDVTLPIGNNSSSLLGKKQLTPISFVNKSVDMKESSSKDNESPGLKFNTANINDIYSHSEIKENITDKALNTDENKAFIKQNTQEGYKFQMDSTDYNTNNKYDDEFNEVILEEISEGKNNMLNKNLPLEEESGKSITVSANNFLSSLGYDSSVTNYRIEDFDHVEDVERAF